MFHRISHQALLPALLIAQFGLAQAGTLMVTSLDDSGAGTLRQAIENASPGDTIVFEAGLSGPIILASPLPALDINLTIEGPGADVITVSGGNQHRVFFIVAGSTVSISGLTIADGSGILGGGIGNEGALMLFDSVVAGNQAEFGFGGGIHNSGGTVVISQSTISGNTAEFGSWHQQRWRERYARPGHPQ